MQTLVGLPRWQLPPCSGGPGLLKAAGVLREDSWTNPSTWTSLSCSLSLNPYNVRHLRWIASSKCSPKVENLSLSSGDGKIQFVSREFVFGNTKLGGKKLLLLGSFLGRKDNELFQDSESFLQQIIQGCVSILFVNSAHLLSLWSWFFFKQCIIPAQKYQSVY